MIYFVIISKKYNNYGPNTPDHSYSFAHRYIDNLDLS